MPLDYASANPPPPATPPSLLPPLPRPRWQTLLLPLALALLGMLIAWAAATTGQDARRARETAQINYDRYYWRWELDEARLKNSPPEEIARIQKILREKDAARVISYARYGRQFTPWDGYRYEEIVDQGYIYHMPDATPAEKADSLIDVGGPERRQKNVVWYPLYPLLATGIMHLTGLSSTNSLTLVSWTCCLLGTLVFFLYARQYFHLRAAKLKLPAASPGKLLVPENAALIACSLLLFGPCSIFLYANFTESLFVLLLAAFLYCLQSRTWWLAALVAAAASACRSQGVLFGPILALVYVVRQSRLAAIWQDVPSAVLAAFNFRRQQPALPAPFTTTARLIVTKLLRSVSAALPTFPIAFILGCISAIGLFSYMAFLNHKFHNPLAFMEAQRYWNVGIGLDRILFAANPVHAFEHLYKYLSSGEIDWPRLWESLCLLWPPIIMLAFGWRYLSLELNILGWILWGLPYVSNSMAGNPPFDTQWMSMGRFMAVSLPIYIIAAGLIQKRPWLALFVLAPWITTFALFAYKYGSGAWVG